jgi:hypothetical protein
VKRRVAPVRDRRVSSKAKARFGGVGGVQNALVLTVEGCTIQGGAEIDKNCRVDGRSNGPLQPPPAPGGRIGL